MRMGGSDNTGDGPASQPRRYRVPVYVVIRVIFFAANACNKKIV